MKDLVGKVLKDILSRDCIYGWSTTWFFGYSDPSQINFGATKIIFVSPEPDLSNCLFIYQ